jgi:MscS family membrane protein
MAILLLISMVPFKVSAYAADPDISPMAMGNKGPAAWGIEFFDYISWRQGIDNLASKWDGAISAMENTLGVYLGPWVGDNLIGEITVARLTLTLGLLVILALFSYMLRVLIRRRIAKVLLDKKKGEWFDLGLAALSRPLSLLVWLWGGFIALSPLFTAPDGVDRSNVIYMLAAEVSGIALPLALIWFIYRLVNNFEAQLVQWAAANQSKTDDLLVRMVGKSLQTLVIIIAAFMLIQNLTGVRVAPLLASLGLGGLAVALAAKDTLANLFGTFTIMMDKPFYLGQRIIVGDKDGSVEAVGYRSTRIRTSDGAQVSIPNSLVVNSMVENVGRRPYLKWETSLGIDPSTNTAGIRQAVRIIEDTLQNHEGMRAEYPPRVFFNDLSNGCLNLSITAWYHPANWWEYQAWVQKTLLEILRRFNEAGITLFFPENTVYVANASQGEFKLGAGPSRSPAQAGQTQSQGPQKP